VPPPGFFTPSPIVLTPSPGLRVALIVALALDAVLSGFFALFGVLGVAGGGSTDSGVDWLAAFFILWFAVTLLGLIGVAIRARWSRWAAIAAGIVVCVTCLGLVLGIPILITAARAPDLKRRSQPA
jgi:hypothetical protein